MDFFAHQERARRRTTLLVVLFFLAVLGLILALYGLVLVVSGVAQERTASTASGHEPSLLRLDVFLAVAAGTVALVGLAALSKIASLSRGGGAVARMLGGRRLNTSTTDLKERQLLNVVEEVAIASGVAVPAVYVLDDEQAINAFAAGWSPKDAVIGVTRGTLEQLNRAELQGVIAHEFSHVFNGDMRLNIRLLGVLFGITCLTTVGYLMLRSMRHGRGRKAGGLVALGLGMMVLGWIGSLFASLIKAAVSRQREFLADASAVQFTRQKEGIAGALRKIGGLSQHAVLRSPHAADCSHMFFGDAMKRAFAGLFATHPPLKERIERIEGAPLEWTAPREAAAAPPSRPAATAAGLAGSTTGLAGSPGSAGGTPLAPESIVDRFGNPGDAHLAFARRFLERLPEPLLEAAHDPLGAQALTCALLLAPAGDVREVQARILREHDPRLAARVAAIEAAVRGLPAEQRLPLAELAVPALKQTEPFRHPPLRDLVKRLAQADLHLSLFEFALQRLLMHHLGADFERSAPRRVTARRVTDAKPEARVILSALAHASSRDPARVENAYSVGVTALENSVDRALLPRSACGLAALDRALDVFAAAAPAAKRDLLAAAAAVVGADGRIAAAEYELLRAIADALDSPLPPLVEEP